MRSTVAAAVMLLFLLPMMPPVAADPAPTCTPVGPCVPVQKMYDDLVGNNAEALGEANVGWLNLDPGNVRVEPLLALPADLAATAVAFTDGLAAVAEGTASAVAGEAARDAEEGSAWVLAIAGEVPTRATASALALAGAGDAIVVVTVRESGAWVSFVNSAGVTLASAAVTSAASAPGSAAGAMGAVTGGGGAAYAQRKALEAAERVVAFLDDPPTDAAQRDVDENGLGDRWEDAVCRSRYGHPGLPADACATVGGSARMAKAYATADFDGDGLSLLDEYRWNSDPLDPETDGDGLPDGPESSLWRRPENDLALRANLWGCPPGAGFEGARTCAWRHPDSFRDDDGDDRPNMGQDPAGPLAALGAGDADSEDDGLTDGDEHYGCRTDPAYGPNAQADPGVPGFAVCGGGPRGHGTDPLEPDTDSDGLTDRQEVCSAAGGACSAAASYGTDPQAPDTDGDAWGDGAEAPFWAGHGGWRNDLDADGADNNLADPDSDRDGIQDGIEAATGLRADRWDTDGDTMPDPWELRYGFEPRDPRDGGVMDPHQCRDATSLGDADLDGLCNAYEYAFQRPSGWNEAHQGEWSSVLNPRDGDMDGDQLPDGKEVLPGSTPFYFSRSAQMHPDTPGTWSGQYPYGWDAAYEGYAGSTRVDLVDTDQDGLTDAYEHQTEHSRGSHTNPNQADSDGDGILDAAEATTDPADWDTDDDGVSDDAEQPECIDDRDCDNDGLDDGEEGACDPRERDADGDGLTDGDERTAGSDCNAADTDADGLDDFQEVRLYDTLPADWDSDDDGLRDTDEVRGTPNAYHHARHATLGDYQYARDRCTRVSAACAADGATDPREADSDDDGLTDGHETATAMLSTLCGDGYCAFTYTNPNRADTDGDGLTDKEELDRGCHFGGRSLDPTNFDMDDDALDDGDEYVTHQSDACDKDTDDDHVEDGAELAFGTSPVKWSTDGDSWSDLQDPRPDQDDDAPVVLGLLRGADGDYRRGACVRVADRGTVQVAQAAVHWRNDDGMFNAWANDTAAAATARWEGVGTEEALCVRWTVHPGTAREFHLVFADLDGNKVTVKARIHAPREIDYIGLIFTGLCFATSGWSGVAVTAVEVGYEAATGDYFESAKGATLGVGEIVAGLKVNGKVLAPTAVKVLGAPVGCILDAATGDFYTPAKTSSLRDLTVVTDETQVDTFDLPGGRKAYLPTNEGLYEAREVQSQAGTRLHARGYGYPYIMVKHQDGHPYFSDEWKDRIQDVLSAGSVTSEPVRWMSHGYSVHTAMVDTGETWSVYVYKGWIYDLVIA